MISKRLKLDIIALVSSISLNVLLTMLLPWMDNYGLVGAPIIGGLLRGILAYRKDLKFIILAMFVLDTFLFVPVISVARGSLDYQTGMLFGVIAGGAQAIIGLIIWGIRYAIYKQNKKSLSDDKLDQLEQKVDSELIIDSNKENTDLKNDKFKT